jgi:hypothetical protein
MEEQYYIACDLYTHDSDDNHYDTVKRLFPSALCCHPTVSCTANPSIILSGDYRNLDGMSFYSGNPK